MNTCLIHQQQYHVYCAYCGMPNVTHTTTTSTKPKTPTDKVELTFKAARFNRNDDEFILSVNGIKTPLQREVFVGLWRFFKERGEK